MKGNFMRLLLSILFILSIFHSTVFIVDEVNCSDNVEHASLHTPSPNNSDSEGAPISHNEQSCLGNHCHACHWAIIGKHGVNPSILKEKNSLVFKNVFYPKGFALDILRPPIV